MRDENLRATFEDMVIRAPIAVKMALGENPKTVYHSKIRRRLPVWRRAIIREQLSLAKRYDHDWQNSKQANATRQSLI